MVSEILEGEEIKVNKIPIEFKEFNNLAYLICTAFSEFNNNRKFYFSFSNQIKDYHGDIIRLVTFTCPDLGIKKDYNYIPATSLTEDEEISDIDMDYTRIMPETYFL